MAALEKPGPKERMRAGEVLLEPGDKVLAPDPGWGPAAVICARCGAELVYYPLRKGSRAQGRNLDYRH